MQELIDQPLITVKQARKLLGDLSKELTNDDIKQLIDQLEHFARLGVQDYMVRKNDKLGSSK